MERKLMDEIAFLYLPIIAGIISLGVITTADITREDYARKDIARTIAFSRYQPVGNGGALAAMNGRISPERKAMYEEINQVYQEIRENDKRINLKL
ncbi:MAG: hypothetical protein Q7S33_01565 [Nanoarchaeota archaeon]|nr:hypothetical protein [Nanoarchaeota archaeon]